MRMYLRLQATKELLIPDCEADISHLLPMTMRIKNPNFLFGTYDFNWTV